MSEPTATEVLRIPSSLDQLPEVDSVLEQIAREMGFGESACADLGISITEAACNAIVHAHHEQPEKTVEISFQRLPGALRITVRDHGAGFELRDVSDPTLPENLLKERGRGLHLIRALMDHVEVHRLPDGMLIVMVKNLVN
jgi:serine/threonine-protein kinase RsbW